MLKHPEIFIDAQLYLIRVNLLKLGERLAGDFEDRENTAVIKATIDEIDATFGKCYEQYANIPEEKNKRTGITLNKRFADYYLLYISPLYAGEEKVKILTTTCDLYRGAILAMAKIINEEGMRIQLAE